MASEVKQYAIFAACALITLALTAVLVWCCIVALEEDSPALRFFATGAVGSLALFLGWSAAKQRLPWHIDITSSEVRLRRAWWSRTFRLGEVELIRVEKHREARGAVFKDPWVELVVLVRGERWNFSCRSLPEIVALATDLRQACGKAVYIDETGQEHVPTTAQPSRTLQNLARERLREGWLNLAVSVACFPFAVLVMVLVLSSRDRPSRPGSWVELFLSSTALILFPLQFIWAVRRIREGRRFAAAAREARGRFAGGPSDYPLE